MSQPETSNGSKRAHQTYADQTRQQMVRLAMKFDRLVTGALEAGESGFSLIRIEYDKGKVTSMRCTNEDFRRPSDG